jgi:hypothetical protein
MKRSFFLLTVLSLSIVISAQNQITIFAGPQATDAYYSVFGVKQSTERKYGFHVGVSMKSQFENNLYFVPTIFYSLKGYSVKFTEFSFPPDAKAINNDTRIHTAELAALLQFDLSKKPSHFYLKAGPSVDFQLFGKEKFDLLSGETVNQDMIFGFADYGRYSANMLFQFGYETNSGFILFAQYSHGMASINNADGGPQIKHRVYGFSIGKTLSRKKIVVDTRVKE